MATPNVTRSAGLAAPLARAVAEDLEAIFPNPSPSDRRLRLRFARRGDQARGVPQRGQGRVAALGAMVAAAFVGVTAGAWFARGPEPERPVQAAAPAPSLRPLAAGPPAVDPSHAVAAVPTSTAGPAAKPAAGPIAVASASPPRPVKAHKISAQKVAAGRASTYRSPARKASIRKPAPTRTARTSPLIEADARLRKAYAAAIRADVPRGVVVDYRNEWERLRHRASDQPGMVATRYNDMAGELKRMAARRQVADASAQPSSRNRRTQLAAQW
ncbi:hypothetical protein LJR225_001467 [Phenylobacterium sp. LjRoot225]|uniref:hypothetical protein n=1 Tax=Phenylobacterium sp. LjRoot225 TaxID=3342285 RepID=UPI003ECE2B70